MAEISTINIDFSLADAVKKEDFFNELSPTDLQLFLQHVTQKVFKKDEVLIQEGITLILMSQVFRLIDCFVSRPTSNPNVHH
jgi:hypothetical protein